MKTRPNDMFDTPFDPREPVDPRQWAMHGLLAAYFEALERTADDRARDILRRIGLPLPVPEERTSPDGPNHAPARYSAPVSQLPVPSSTANQSNTAAREHSLSRHWGGGLVAAAAVLLAIIGYVATVAPTPAVADSFGQAAQALLLLTTMSADFDALLLEDTERLAEMNCQAEQCFAVRDAALRAFERGELPFDQLSAVYSAWARGYRLWRSMGRWQAALDEMRALADHAERFHSSTSGESPWPHIAWTDVGDTLLILGDLTGARGAYLESLNRRERIATAARERGGPATDYVGAELNTLAPVYWRLSDLALAEGDMAAAAAWLAAGEDLLYAYFAAVCVANGICFPPDADALTLVEQYVPDERRTTPVPHACSDEQLTLTSRQNGLLPDPGLLAKLRSQAYRVARLKRFAGDRVGAEILLKRGWALTSTHAHDEERLAFVMPLEFARLAIAQDDWLGALYWLDVAREQCTARVESAPGVAERAPISALRRAELTLLTSLVGMKLSPKEAAHYDLARRTLRSLEGLGSELTETQRTQFLEQFRAWRELLQVIDGPR